MEIQIFFSNGFIQLHINDPWKSKVGRPHFSSIQNNFETQWIVKESEIIDILKSLHSEKANNAISSLSKFQPILLYCLGTLVFL